MEKFFLGTTVFIFLVALVGGSTLHGEGHAAGDWGIPPETRVENENDQEIFMVEELPPFAKQAASEKGIRRRASIDTTIPARTRVDVLTCEVKPGDNLFLIADKFDLKPETVLWGNYDVLQDNPQFLRPGQELNILPVYGVYYQWNGSDSLTRIADFFGVSPEAILEYPGNDIDLYDMDTANPSIEEGKWLIVPGGKQALKDWGPPAISRTNPAMAKYYGSGSRGSIVEGAVGTGSFVWPTVLTRISGYNFNPSLHPGLDIAGNTGNAVFATDSGVVVYSGWSEYGYGNLIVLHHGGG